jgi:DNA-binding XRE family transcriptional regulator
MKTKSINLQNKSHEMHTPGFRLVELCKELGFTVPQLAQECGMDKSRRTFYKIFHEGHAPSTKIVRAICARFPQINFDYIFTGTKKIHDNESLNASNTQNITTLVNKELNMINGFIKLETELVRTSNALQTTLLNCTNQIQEMVVQNAKTKNDFETHIVELNKQLGALSASNLKLSTQILKVEGKVNEMHHDNSLVAIQAKEYITESQESHKRNHAFQQQIIPDLGEYRKTKKKS